MCSKNSAKKLKKKMTIYLSGELTGTADKKYKLYEFIRHGFAVAIKLYESCNNTGCQATYIIIII